MSERFFLLLLLSPIFHFSVESPSYLNYQSLSTMNNHATALYDKLNNVHTSLRKQKEDAYRAKQLAEQRLALACQDREAFEKKGVEMKNQLRQLKENAVQMKAGNSKLEVECKHVEKEVRVICWCVCGVGNSD